MQSAQPERENHSGDTKGDSDVFQQVAQQLLGRTADARDAHGASVLVTSGYNSSMASGYSWPPCSMANPVMPVPARSCRVDGLCHAVIRVKVHQGTAAAVWHAMNLERELAQAEHGSQTRVGWMVPVPSTVTGVTP
jgi:hypothetical protein